MCNKKYKLIQEYPGGPKEGSVFEFGDWGLSGECYQYKGYNRIERLSKDVVENSPKFFQLIENEPKFQILSYYAKNISGKGDDYVDPNYIWKEKSPGKWARITHSSFVTEPYSTEEITNHNGYGIHSVKRLSDGEVFTIGDKCNLDNGNGYRNPIVKIELTKNGISGHLEQYRNKETIKITLETNSGKSWGPFEFDCIQKSKIPLLTTEDGVEIFKGGEFWEVFSNYSNIAKVNSDCIETFLFNSSTRKAFSTKEKAQEFVENNKKKYSLNDIEKSLGILDKHLGNPLLGDVKRHILYHISDNI